MIRAFFFLLLLCGSAFAKAGFQLMPPAQTGVTFSNLLSVDRFTTNQIYLNGSGVAAGDVDGDGKCDLYFCALDNNNVLYRNLGDWKFQDITAAAGVSCAGLDATGAALADLDADGDLDLVVNTVGGGTEIFANDGRAHFSKVAVLNPGKGGMSLALADIDGDGRLDIYVVNYRTVTVRDQPNTRFQGETVDGKMVIHRVNGRPVTEPDLANRFTLDVGGKMLEHGEAHVLYRNEGNWKFSAVSFTDGSFLDEDGQPLREPPFDWGLSAMFRDINGDGAPDLYVCNDFHSPDRFWINDGKGRFRAAPRLALRHTSMFSMGVDFADINRDGYDDFFVADMLSREHRRRQTQIGNLSPMVLPIGLVEDRPQYSFNNLQLNRGDGTFAEIARLCRIDASDWSWASIFMDADLDGYEDLFITTGHERDALHMDHINAQEAKKNSGRLSGMELLNMQRGVPRLATAKAAFRNRGDLTFEEVTASWGFGGEGIAHGMCLADLDNDGDQDIAVNSLNGPAALYRNESDAPRVGVRLRGNGTGARIKLVGGPVSQSQEMISGGRYLSSDDPMRVFAAAKPARIEVRWRSGKKSVLENAKPNEIHMIDETSAQPAALELPRKPVPIFQNASQLLNHRHHEESYDDFARQPLLPFRLSQLGPGISWSDFDGDGLDDLIVGSGRGGRISFFRNNGQGGFAAFSDPFLERPLTRDQTAIIGSGPLIIAGSANYEDGLTNGGAIRIYDLQRKATGESVIGQASSRGPLAMADIDANGTLDLFVGGRVNPARYPEPADSILLRNEGSRFAPHQRFEKIGLVSGATFSDLDGDGKPELILACEWGTVRVFQLNGANYVDTTEKLGLAKQIGWWNGVATGDFNNDGLLDIVASNWGHNSRYHAPRFLYYGDINGAGGVDLVEAYFDPQLNKEVPERVLKSAAGAMPFLESAFPTYERYSVASVAEIYGEKLKKCVRLEANTLSSTLFLNRGDHFEAIPLPVEAQFAPAFGISVADMDGDGNEDIFLAQNFFATNPEMARCDGGRGLWLRGDGRGQFTAVSGQESGVMIYGEQRASALADFDGDGRIDLAVSQNGAATMLFRNTGAKPGLRVTLRGNPNVVGASMRLSFGAKEGPRREIRAGSGYLSQDGLTQVLGMPEAPTQISVRWPGGKTTVSVIPSGAKAVEIAADGNLRVTRAE